MTWPIPKRSPVRTTAESAFCAIDGGVVELRRVEAHVAVAAVLLELLAEVAEQHAAPARGCLCERDHGLELVELDADLLGVAAVLDERAGGDGVLEAEEAQRLGGQAVSAGAAGLLVVALDVLGHVVVDDEAHVGLVDAHAEGDGRDHDVHLVAQERVLDPRALGRRQTRVVGGGLHAGGCEASRRPPRPACARGSRRCRSRPDEPATNAASCAGALRLSVTV